MGYRLHHDKHIIVLDLDIETTKPQLAVIRNRVAAGKIEFEACQGQRRVAGPVHLQHVGPIAIGIARHAAVLEIGALVGAAAADGLDFTRRQARQQYCRALT